VRHCRFSLAQSAEPAEVVYGLKGIAREQHKMVIKMKSKRRKLNDVLLYGKQEIDVVMSDYAVGPFDELVNQMDKKWGVDRLPDLVSVETAQKYGSAIAKLNDAIADGVPEVVAARAQVCMRGLHAMDAEATKLGAQGACEDVWEFAGKKVYGIMRDQRSWKAVKERRPDLKLVSVREVVLALEYYEQKVAKAVDEVKEVFPDAEVIAINDDANFYDEEIPF